MELLFVLSDRSSISTFISSLKLLHAQSTEVLLSFSNSGLSISQSWKEKNLDIGKGKYFCFLEAFHFSKINCRTTNTTISLNIKEILSKLKSYKREIQEIFISISNEDSQGRKHETYCLIEFILTLESYGTIIYRNACRLEKSLDFIPLAYYEHIHANKTPLLIVEPSKVEFLHQFRNYFIELTLHEDRVELCDSINQHKINVNAISCFRSYNYESFINLCGEISTIALSPNHLIRYMDLCSKSKRDMMIYFGKLSNVSNTINLYFPIRIDRSLIIIKAKTQVIDTIMPRKEKGTRERSEAQSRIHQSATSTCHDDNQSSYYSIRSLAIRPTDSVVKNSQSSVVGTYNTQHSVPCGGVLTNFNLRSAQSMNKKSKNPFMFSQELDQKKTRKNTDVLKKGGILKKVSFSQVEKESEKKNIILDEQSYADDEDYSEINVNGLHSFGVQAHGFANRVKEESKSIDLGEEPDIEAKLRMFNEERRIEKVIESKTMKFSSLLQNSSGKRRDKPIKEHSDSNMLNQLNKDFSKKMRDVSETMKL